MYCNANTQWQKSIKFLDSKVISAVEKVEIFVGTEGTGFEPAVPCGTLPFQDSALDQLCDPSLYRRLTPFDPECFNK